MSQDDQEPPLVSTGKAGNAPGDSGDRDREGRIVGRSKLTAKQLRFVTELRKGMTQTEAAKRAGYAVPAVAASQMLRSGPVADLIRAGKRRIVGQASSAAVAMLAGTVLGKFHPSRVQYDAARFMIELDRQMTAEENGKDNDTKDLRGLSLPQLLDMAAKVKTAPMPIGTMETSQPIEKTEESTS
jgi:hypothetical protein